MAARTLAVDAQPCPDVGEADPDGGSRVPTSRTRCQGAVPSASLGGGRPSRRGLEAPRVLLARLRPGEVVSRGTNGPNNGRRGSAAGPHLTRKYRRFGKRDPKRRRGQRCAALSVLTAERAPSWLRCHRGPQCVPNIGVVCLPLLALNSRFSR